MRTPFPTGGPKARTLSKKEKEAEAAQHKGQGSRLAKAGPRRRKFDAEAAAEREASK